MVSNKDGQTLRDIIMDRLDPFVTLSCAALALSGMLSYQSAGPLTYQGSSCAVPVWDGSYEAVLHFERKIPTSYVPDDKCQFSVNLNASEIETRADSYMEGGQMMTARANVPVLRDIAGTRLAVGKNYNVSGVFSPLSGTWNLRITGADAKKNDESD